MVTVNMATAAIVAATIRFFMVIHPSSGGRCIWRKHRREGGGYSASVESRYPGSRGSLNRRSPRVRAGVVGSLLGGDANPTLAMWRTVGLEVGTETSSATRSPLLGRLRSDGRRRDRAWRRVRWSGRRP